MSNCRNFTNALRDLDLDDFQKFLAPDLRDKVRERIRDLAFQILARDARGVHEAADIAMMVAENVYGAGGGRTAPEVIAAMKGLASFYASEAAKMERNTSRRALDDEPTP